MHGITGTKKLNCGLAVALIYLIIYVYRSCNGAQGSRNLK
jgi:hypothetical protein